MTATASPESPKVVIYGGLGFFGSRVADDLVARTDCRVVLAGRHEPPQPLDPRVAFVRSDLGDAKSVSETLAGAFAVVHCAGPYKSQQPTVARAAIECGAHYVDLSEDIDFTRRVNAWDEAARQAGVAVLSGLSVVPALAVLLATALAGKGERVVLARTFVAPGSRGSRGEATIRALMGGIGAPLRLWRGGVETRVRGWSEPEWILFPPPVGWRLQYLAIETSGSDPMARELGAQAVEFKAGSEFPWLNRGLAVVARVRARLGFPRLESHAKVLGASLALLGRFGTDRGGVCVEIARTSDGIETRKRIAVVAQREGERIPAVLAGIVVAALVKGELKIRGVPELSTLLAPARLFDELRARGLRLWWQADAASDWESLIDPGQLSTP